MSVGLKKRLQHGALAVAAALLIVAIGFGGCDMKSNAVTERDVEVARQMGAPDDVMASLEAGRWPSDLVREKVQNAEACIDYLNDKYGLEFSAVSATGGATWMTHEHDVTLRIESGEHAGEEVHLKYDPGVRNGKQEYEPSFKEDCYYVVNHEEWERIASEAIAPVLEGLPEGGWFVETQMSRSLYPTTQTGLRVTDGGGAGRVDVFVDMEACNLTEDGMQSMLAMLQLNMEQTGLRGTCSVNGCASDYISARQRPRSAERAWSETLPFGV